jgi:hypothetical protein
MKGSGVEHEEQSAAEQKIRIWVPLFKVDSKIDRQRNRQAGRQTHTDLDRHEKTGEQRDVQQKIVNTVK